VLFYALSPGQAQVGIDWGITPMAPLTVEKHAKGV
jgi:hypothetical protein